MDSHPENHMDTSVIHEGGDRLIHGNGLYIRALRSSDPGIQVSYLLAEA